MAQEELPTSLQESLLALLMFDVKHGSAVAAQVKPEHFDGPYQEVATRILAYRAKYGKPPGKAQLDDLFGWALEKGERAPRLRRLMSGILTLSEGINPEYIASKTQSHIRQQTLKAALLQASERYQQGGDDLIPEVERILHTALSTRQDMLDAGTFLNDPKALSFLNKPKVDYPIGIKELDANNIGANKGQMLLYIGPKNSGKTWFCVHMGTQGILHQAKILHITLEMGEEDVVARYYQRFFNGSWSDDSYKVVQFELDSLDRIEGFRTRGRKPKIVFSTDEGKKLLREKLKQWGLRFRRLVIKQFPTGQLTVPQLYGYLDYLESVHKFIPTMIILDYPDLMKISPSNQRIDLGRTYVALRGLAVERSMALIVPTQGGRQTIDARMVNSNDVSEDISKVFTADNTLTYSRTVAEQRDNLARVHVAHARYARAGQTIAISQAYDVGQYVLYSHPQSSRYWELVRGNESSAE